jgi:hypothetical protein
VVSVPPIVSVVPEEIPKSTPTVPLLLKSPVTESVPAYTIPKFAEEVVSEIEPTVTGVVSETVPNWMTALSPGAGTPVGLQLPAVSQSPVPSFQFFVAISIPFAHVARAK